MAKKILIVDDDMSILDIYSTALRLHEYSVCTATNGQEGLDIALVENPDLILLDIAMPVMDGLAMLQKLRKESEWGKSVPVILLTGLSADKEEIVRKVAETAPLQYIVKGSLNINQVVDRVKEVLKG